MNYAEKSMGCFICTVRVTNFRFDFACFV